jgi:glutamine synthetase
MLAAGLKGIENKYELPENIDTMIKQNREDEIKSIPTHLHDALNSFRTSGLMKETLGPVLFEKFLQNKLFEEEEYKRHITDFEIQKYLPVL